MSTETVFRALDYFAENADQPFLTKFIQLGHNEIVSRLTKRALSREQLLDQVVKIKTGSGLSELKAFHEAQTELSKAYAHALASLRIPRDGDQRSELMSITIPK